MPACQQQASRGWRARHEEGHQGASVGSAAALPLVSGDTGMPAPPTASGLMLARLQAGRQQQQHMRSLDTMFECNITITLRCAIELQSSRLSSCLAQPGRHRQDKQGTNQPAST